MIYAPKPISPNDLNLALAGPNRPHLYDICTNEDHADFPFLLPGTRRITPGDLPHLEGPAVIICQKGLKLSQGAAALLHAQGQDAEYLTGGIQAWHAAKLPLVRADAIPAHWVTPAGTQAHLVRWMVAHLCGDTQNVMCVSPDVIGPVTEKFDAVIVDTAADVLAHLRVASDVLTALTEIQDTNLLEYATQAEAAAFWSLHHRHLLTQKGL